MDGRILAARLREFGEAYRTAAQRLNAKDLRAFVLHESQWFRHQPDTWADFDAFLECLVQEATDYLEAVLELYPPPKPAYQRPRIQE